MSRYSVDRLKSKDHPSPVLNRRHFLAATSAGLSGLLLPSVLRAAAEPPPADNPLATLRLAWTDSIRWANVVDVTQASGANLMEKIAQAQGQLAAQGGGVLYFPPGVCHITNTIRLKDGVVLRGAAPAPGRNAHDEQYALPSRLEFPRYVFSNEGDGTPLDTAFKGVVLENPATASNCGVVHLDLNRGHVFFDETVEHGCGRNRLVFGCRLRNAALPNKDVPDLTMGQKPWQRYTATWDRAAIQVFSVKNALVAGNRLPRSGEDNSKETRPLARGRRRSRTRCGPCWKTTRASKWTPRLGSRAARSDRLVLDGPGNT